MTYVLPNFKTKKALKEAIRNQGDGAFRDENGNKPVSIFEPGLGTVPNNGTVYLEGPHYPAPHTWYGVGTIVNGKLVAVK